MIAPSLRRARLTRPTSPPGRICRGDLVALGVIVVFTAIAAWNRFDYDAWLTRHDLLTFFLPWLGYLGERLRDFDIPGWDPYLFSGHPFAGDPESGWMFLPAMVAFPFFSAITALKVMIVIQLLIAGMTTYWLGRVLGMGVVASLVAAVVFEFGQFLQYVTYCCTVRGFISMWLPLALIGVELAFRATSWRDRVAPWFLTGFAISQMFAGWMGQGVVVALLVIAAWVGYRALLSPPQGGWDVRTRLVQCVMTGGAVVGLGVALGAAGIFLRLSVNAQTNLAGGDYDRLGQPHAANPLTIEPLIHYIFSSGYHSRAVALGGTALVLAMLAPFLAGRRFGTPYFLGLTLVVYTMMLDTTPLHELFYLIPRFQTLHEHSPHQISTVVAIGPAMLSGAAVEALRSWRGRWWVLGLLVVPMLAIVLVGRWLDDFRQRLGWEVYREVYVAAAVVTVVLILTVVLPTLWRRSPALARFANGLPTLIVVVAFVQPTGMEVVGSISGDPADPVYRGFFRPDPAFYAGIAPNMATTDDGGAASFLQQRQAMEPPFRYVGYGGAGFPGERLAAYEDRRMEPRVIATLQHARPLRLHLQSIQGYDPLQLQHYVDYMTALNRQPQNYHKAHLLAGGTGSPLLNLLNVRYIVLDATLPTDRWDVVALTAGKREVYRTSQVVIYQNPAAMPRAWIVHDVRPDNNGAGLQQLADGVVDGREVAFVAGEPPAGLNGGAQVTPAAQWQAGEVVERSSTATVTRWEADEMTIRTRASQEGFLVASEVYEKNWRAYLNGESTELYRTNGALRGVAIPAGEHTVEFRYEPPSLAIGLWVTGISTGAMLVAFAYAAWAWWARTRRLVEAAA